MKKKNQFSRTAAVSMLHFYIIVYLNLNVYLSNAEQTFYYNLSLSNAPGPFCVDFEYSPPCLGGFSPGISVFPKNMLCAPLWWQPIMNFSAGIKKIK